MNPYRLALAERMGVDLAVDVRSTTLDEVMKQLGIREGSAVGLEMSGQAAAFQDMLRHRCHGEKIAMLGIPSNELAIDWNKVIFSMLTPKGIYGREM